VAAFCFRPKPIGINARQLGQELHCNSLTTHLENIQLCKRKGPVGDSGLSLFTVFGVPPRFAMREACGEVVVDTESDAHLESTEFTLGGCRYGATVKPLYE
jgi:hypothetical protein